MLDRFAQFAAVAAREAVKPSGIEFSPGTGESELRLSWLLWRRESDRG